MGIAAEFSTERTATGSTERRTPFSPPLKGGLRGESPAPSAAERSERADKAEWVRANLPLCAEAASAFRDVFPGCRMAYASEDGNVIGAPYVAGFSIGGDDLMPIRSAKP